MRFVRILVGAALVVSMNLLPAAPAHAGSVSAAKSRVANAKDYVESGRMDVAEDALKAAEKQLEGLTDAEKAPIIAEIKALREKIANAIKPEDERAVRAAKGKLRQAKSEIDDKRPKDVIEGTLEAAERYVKDVPDKWKADVMTEIAAVRKQVGLPAKGGAAAAEPSKPSADKPAAATPAPTGALTDEQTANLSKAKGFLRSATSLTETGRTDDADAALEKAELLLPDLPESHRIALAVEIAAARKASRDAATAEKLRSINEAINRFIGSAENSLDGQPVHSAQAIELATKRLAEPDAQQYLSAAQVADYQARLNAVKKKLAAANKADALDRAEGLLKQIEDQLKDDPFKGKNERDAYSVHSGLQSLRKGALSWIDDLPPGDADAQKLRDRITAADQQIAKAEAAWGKAVLDAQVGGSWDAIKKDIAGWEQETPDPKAQPLDSPTLPKSSLAVNRIGHWLNDEETKKTRAENKGDAKLEATYGEAEKVFEAAAAKLAAAYNAVLAGAEKMETPMRRFELDRPSLIAVSAEYALAGTKQGPAVIARARKLDQRWEAEVAAIMKARQELCDKLTAEAEAKWPAMEAKLNPVRSFDAATAGTAMKGKLILLKGVYNRSAWDFSGRNHQFVSRINGMPIGGNYEPHVQKAMEHAWYELKIDTDDHIPWDVIGVVEGPGKIGERVIVTLKDRDTNLEIGKLEEYRPIDCVNIRIIAMRAGPVAVAPGK